MRIISLLILLILVAGATNSIAQLSADFETTNITTNTLVASSFISDDEGWMADDGGNLWHTSNAGNSWSSITTEKYFLKLDFTDALHGFALTVDAAFKTIDGGNNWTALYMPGNVGSTLYFFDNNTGLISGNGVIYKTADGGSNWSSVSTEGISFIDFYFVNSSTGIGAAYDEENYECLWRTTDGGATWSNVYHEKNYFITSVWFTDENNGWAAGYYTEMGRGQLPIINHTSDGGATWENVYFNDHPGDIIGEALIDIRFKNSLEGVAIASYSENVITSDGGVTWNLTYDENEDLIPSYGIYQALGGYSDIYLTGRKGNVTKWK